GSGARRQGGDRPRGRCHGIADRADRLRRKKKKLLRSWDRMVIPLPFTRALFLYGEPILVPRDGDVEEWRLRIEERMNNLADSAEREFDALWNGTK
ncbi:MAG TPA: hypothetical protein VGJ81_22030, partial [Thermoanaerobaculia bacterium]